MILRSNYPLKIVSRCLNLCSNYKEIADLVLQASLANHEDFLLKQLPSINNISPGIYVLITFIFYIFRIIVAQCWEKERECKCLRWFDISSHFLKVGAWERLHEGKNLRWGFWECSHMVGLDHRKALLGRKLQSCTRRPLAGRIQALNPCLIAMHWTGSWMWCEPPGSWYLPLSPR